MFNSNIFRQAEWISSANISSNGQYCLLTGCIQLNKANLFDQNCILKQFTCNGYMKSLFSPNSKFLLIMSDGLTQIYDILKNNLYQYQIKVNKGIFSQDSNNCYLYDGRLKAYILQNLEQEIKFKGFIIIDKQKKKYLLYDSQMYFSPFETIQIYIQGNEFLQLMFTFSKQFKSIRTLNHIQKQYPQKIKINKYIIFEIIKNNVDYELLIISLVSGKLLRHIKYLTNLQFSQTKSKIYSLKGVINQQEAIITIKNLYPQILSDIHFIIPLRQECDYEYIIQFQNEFAILKFSKDDQHFVECFQILQ